MKSPDQKMTIVFQYGSNMSSLRLNAPERLQGDARPIGIAVTAEDYELEFDIWSKTGNCAAADIIAGSGRKIWGVLYEIPEFLIKRDTAGARKSLDAIEGEGKNYRRRTIALKWPDGRPVSEPVSTYIGLTRQKDIETTADYIQHALAGLSEHSFPGDYVTYVKARILANNPKLAGAFPGL